MIIQAVQQIRRMRGGSQAHLMLCSDKDAYITKFQNNPQHRRILAKEMLANKIADMVGLPVPACAIVEVSKDVIDRCTDLDLDYGRYRQPCQAGASFGSRLVGGLMPGYSLDYLPEEKLTEVVNLEEFAGVLAFDKWTCNADGRQAVFHSRNGKGHFRATFIDHGFCFGGESWGFVDAPLRGVYARNVVYENISGWDSFEPWLSRMETFDADKIFEIVTSIPAEWYAYDVASLEQVCEKLIKRRHGIRSLIDNFRTSSRNPFPNWRRTVLRSPGRSNGQLAPVLALGNV